MPARCHNDTCSVEWREVSVPTPAYEANVITDADSATPTIECGADGLEVMLSATAGQILTVAADGLLAVLPAAVVQTFNPTPANKGVGPGADDAGPQSSDPYSWTNTTGRDALVLVSGEFNFEYGILGPDHAYAYASGTGQKARPLGTAAYDGVGNKPLLSPFNAQLAMRLKANIGAPPTTSRKATRVGIGGLVEVSTPTGAELKIERIPFFWMVRVGAGATLNMKSEAFYQGPSQTVNVGAFPGMGSGFAGTGHELWNLQVAAVPI